MRRLGSLVLGAVIAGVAGCNNVPVSPTAEQQRQADALASLAIWSVEPPGVQRGYLLIQPETDGEAWGHDLEVSASWRSDDGVSPVPLEPFVEALAGWRRTACGFAGPSFEGSPPELPGMDAGFTMYAGDPGEILLTMGADPHPDRPTSDTLPTTDPSGFPLDNPECPVDVTHWPLNAQQSSSTTLSYKDPLPQRGPSVTVSPSLG